jgi:hypothetical protein
LYQKRIRFSTPGADQEGTPLDLLVDALPSATFLDLGDLEDHLIIVLAIIIGNIVICFGERIAKDVTKFRLSGMMTTAFAKGYVSLRSKPRY